MPDIEHSTITDPNIHEPKGAASAANNTVLTGNGAGGSSFKTTPLFGENSSSSSPTDFQTPVYDAGNSEWVPLSNNGYHFLIDGTYTSSSKLSITASTRTKVLVDGATANRAFPSGTVLWNTSTNKIVGTENEQYFLALSFNCSTAATSSYVTVEIDVGGTTGSFFNQSKSLVKGASVTNSLVFNYPLFVGTDFASNGAELYITPNDNTDFWDFAISLIKIGGAV